MIFSPRNKIKFYIQSRRVFPESLNAIGVKSTGFSIVFIGKTARNSFRVLVARKFARYISIHRNFIVHTYTHVTVRYKMFVCTRARSSRAFLFSPFLALVIGRFHRQSRRVSVARSARCDVVQGQGHMVTGGRGGHTSYRYISTTGRDPPPPLSPSPFLPPRHHRRRSARPPLPPIDNIHMGIPISRLNTSDVCMCEHTRRLTLRRGLLDLQGHAIRQHTMVVTL